MTLLFSLWLEEFTIWTKKQPSADVKPASHKGSGIKSNFLLPKEREAGIMEWKFSFSSEERPLFKEALYKQISLIPLLLNVLYLKLD